MGLNDNMNKLNNTQQEIKDFHEKQLKKADDRKIIDMFFIKFFEDFFGEAETIKELAKRKRSILYYKDHGLKRILQDFQETMPSFKLTLSDRFYISSNYEKYVNTAYKKYEYIIKSELKELETEAKELEKAEKEQQKQLEKNQKEIEKEKLKLQKELEAERIRKAEARKTIIEALKTTCIILLSPLMIIAFMVIAICKDKNFK